LSARSELEQQRPTYFSPHFEITGMRTIVVLVLPLLIGASHSIADEKPAVKLVTNKNSVVINVNQKSVATYVFADKKIRRPYFAHVKSPSGIQVTRNHPPIQGQDSADHDTMHPGIWMAFGDLNGADFWRNKADVVHHKFTQQPIGGSGVGSFVEEKRYVSSNGEVVCEEKFKMTFRVRKDCYLLEWDSTFSSDQEFYFGDQEEMGLGIRVATPITELKGGQLVDSTGRKTAKSIWSHASNWCDYSRVIDGQRIGMTVFCHPKNFRGSWMHARNYGLIAANAFGRNAMRKGKPSRLVVKPDQPLRIRYGVLIRSTNAGNDLLKQEYDHYTQRVND
jgi:hypothetical protein